MKDWSGGGRGLVGVGRAVVGHWSGVGRAVVAGLVGVGRAVVGVGRVVVGQWSICVPAWFKTFLLQ